MGAAGGAGGGEERNPPPLNLPFHLPVLVGGGISQPLSLPPPQIQGDGGTPLSGAPFLPPPLLTSILPSLLWLGGLLINRKNWGLKFDEFRAEIPILMPGGGRGGKGGNLRRISSGFAVFPPRGFNTAISTSGASLMIRNIY